MPLGSPAVVGPTSVCSEAVLVVGHLDGATVNVLQDGQSVGKLEGARGGNAAIPIDRTRLKVGHRLVATQELGSEASAPSPKGVEVEKALNGTVGNPHALYRCAQSVTVANCSPGAQIELVQQGVVIGRDQAFGDVARIKLAAGSGLSSKRVDFRQTLCTGATQVSMGRQPTAAPTVARGLLPTPSFALPPKECHTALSLATITPGAEVTLRRNGNTIFAGSISDPVMNLHLGALSAGETLTASQSLPRCKLLSNERAVTVSPLGDLVPPGIDGPICRGAHRITLSRLEPGAIVRVFADGQELGRWETSSDRLLVDLAMPPGAAITAQQELCGKVSPRSREYVLGGGGGRWFLVEDASGKPLAATAFAVHAALVRTGKIVMFSGDQHSPEASIAHRYGPCQLFDCDSLTIEQVDAPTTDVFCSGHALMADGRLLVAGGTESFPPGGGAHGPLGHFPGLPDSWIFDPVADAGGNHWTRHPSMRRGRWYPTLLTMADGRVLAMNGHPEGTAPASDHNNDALETSDGGAWTWLGRSPQLTNAPTSHYYPRIFVGPSGKVFSATPLDPEGGQPPKSGNWDPNSGGVDWKHQVPPPSGWDGRDDLGWPYALLPLFEDEDPAKSFRFFVLIAGMKAPWITDLGTPADPNPSPAWKPFGNRRRRLHSMLVSLANSWVMLCGGVRDRNDDNTAEKEPEFLAWNGDAWAWASGRRASASVPRNYHTSTLLMPDGRVFVAGSNINAQSGFANVRRLEVEIYAPWYCCYDRPRIVAAPRELDTGQTLNVEVRGGEAERLVLIRAGSSTHSFNPDERHISLIARKGEEEGSYWAPVPQRPVTVPGWYLLFAVTADGAPSEGVWVKLP